MTNPGLALIAVLAAVCVFLVWRLWQTRGTIGPLTATNARLRRDLDSVAERQAMLLSQFAALGAASEDLLIAVDDDGRVTHANRMAQARFGPLPSAAPSLIEFTRSLPVDELAADALRGAPGSEVARVIEVRDRPHRARAVRFDGGAALAFTDASEIQRLGRARRDFIANISHELRTPLTSIRLLVESLLSGGSGDPREVAEALKKVEVETETLQQMAQELLDLAQIESGRVLVRMVPTPVAPLIAAVVDRLGPQAAHKRQTVSVEAPADLVLLADPDQVGRALGNLVHNAIKFTPAEGTIRVGARPVDGDIEIRVADTGPGLPLEDLPRVFERFFRGDRSRASGGTGLGLAIAKHVVEAHGGRIWAESDGMPGHGAVFRFTLPAANQDEREG